MIRLAAAAAVISSLWSAPVLGASFGVGSYINSLGAENQPAAVDLLAQTKSALTRLEVPYDPATDWVQLDSAVAKIAAKGIKILILFAYKDGLSANVFEGWVDTVVGRYKDNADGYEIFNEIDNILSAGDYKPFLEKAYNKIKAIDSSAAVVASGLTGRKEAINFWNGLYDAGGAPYFDALGLHPYRTSSPETKEFNNGSMVDSINQAVAVINGRGGGKKVWITEFGWRSSEVDESTQGKFLARAFLLAASADEVQQVLTYNLFDGASQAGYGIANQDYSRKGSFGAVETAIKTISGKTFSEKVAAASAQSIDNFDGGVTAWQDDGSQAGSVGLSSTAGRNGSGMKFAWNFSGQTSYVIARKQKKLSGEPTGLSIWINGDNQTSVWKLRVKDAAGETFQFDLGQAPSGWRQFIFDFAKDKAKTSWGGDGSMDYPIIFDSLVLDNQGGSSSGEVLIDDIAALYGDTDLYALRFDSTLAYWKASGGATAALCGKELNFTTDVQYTTVDSCDAQGNSQLTTNNSQPAAAPTSPKPSTQKPSPPAASSSLPPSTPAQTVPAKDAPLATGLVAAPTVAVAPTPRLTPAPTPRLTPGVNLGVMAALGGLATVALGAVAVFLHRNRKYVVV